MNVVLVTYALFVVLEKVCTGYQWPKKPFWIVRGLFWLLFVVFGGELLSTWIHDIVHPYAPLDLSFLGLWAVAPALIVYQMVIYFFHRALHDIPFLWRIHQTHHSVERLDIWSTYHVHPLELLIFTIAGLLLSSGFLGITAEASYWLTLILVPIQLFEHTNVQTPKWLGYIIARPENHMLHHAAEHHRANYADIPIVDMLFGTFELPESAPEKVGFWDGASGQFVDKMLCKDITKENV